MTSQNDSFYPYFCATLHSKTSYLWELKKVLTLRNKKAKECDLYVCHSHLIQNLLKPCSLVCHRKSLNSSTMSSLYLLKMLLISNVDFDWHPVNKAATRGCHSQSKSLNHKHAVEMWLAES